MAASAMFIGLSAFHAEEDPNDQFVYDRTESVLHLSLDAPGGTSLSPGNPAAAVGVLLERYSWQIWRQPSIGLEEYRTPVTEPESGATVTLTRSPEIGTLAESTLTTGSDGRAWTTFSPDGATSNVSIDATSDDSTATLERRARSYLDVNCSHCHQPAAPTQAAFDARLETPPFFQNLINVTPGNNLGISGARLVSPGRPDLSIACVVLALPFTSTRRSASIAGPVRSLQA